MEQRLTKRIDEVLEVARFANKHGVTTEAEWVKHLRTQQKLIPGLAHLKPVDWWFEGGQAPGPFPGLGTGESPRDGSAGTQAFVTKMLTEINSATANGELPCFGKRKDGTGFVTTKNTTTNAVHFAVPDAFSRPSFGTRKPDVVCHPKGLQGALGISLLGDVKGRSGDGDFPEAEIGHILDMTRQLLREFQPSRSFAYCFLTDGDRFQFFLVTRTESDELEVKQSVVFRGITGWQVRQHVRSHPLVRARGRGGGGGGG
jgi:hypothetical protein